MLVSTIGTAFEPAATAPNAIEALSDRMRDLLELTIIRPQTLERALEDLRSNRPQFLPWQDALTYGLIAISRGDSRTAPRVRLTTAGLRALRNARRNRVLQQSKPHHK